MNRQKLLITACVLAAISLGANFYLLAMRRQPPPPAPEKAEPKLPTVAEFDFSGTGLSDDSWKLKDEPRPGVNLEKPFKLEIKDPPTTTPTPP